MSIFREFTGFRFNSDAGFDNLARAIANGVVADNHHTTNPLTKGQYVAILAKCGVEYFAVAAVAKGSCRDITAQEIWPNWSPKAPNTKIHEVTFKTQICKIPAELARRCDTTAIRAIDAEELALYCFANG